MQDKYTGDIGDYGKYCLLDELFKQAGGKIRLGINWYYATHKETAKGDGRHIAYLNDENKNRRIFEACSPNLYGKLKTIVTQNQRSIADIEASKVLPKGTICYSAPVPHFAKKPDDRISQREAWFRKSLSQLDQTDIIFLDPDNGIHLEPSMKRRLKAVKYVFPDEMEAYYRLGKSLVVYNHRDRQPREKYEKKILVNRKFVKSPSDVRVLRFIRVSVRDHIFVIQKRHRAIINRTIALLTKPPYDFLFREYTYGEKGK